MNDQVIVYSVVLTTSFFLLPFQAAAQAVSIYGPDPAARECHDSAKRAVDLDMATPGALRPCTKALGGGKLETRDRAATHVNRGVLNAALGDYERANHDYDAAMDLYPRYGAIYVNRGNIFFLSESYDSAIVEYTKALEAEMREYQIAYLNRGMAYENLGHWKDAEADYRRALELAPDWILASIKLARVLGKMN